MKKILIGLIMIVFLITGCGGGGLEGSSGDSGSLSVSEGQWRTSPMGFWVRVPDSIYGGGLFLPDGIVKDPLEIDLILTDAVDARTQEWCSKNNYDCDKVNVKFVLHDGFDFPCSGKPSETGLCAGFYLSGTIYASIYTMWRGYDPPNFISPPHTWMTVEEREAIIGWKSPYDYTFYAGIGEPLCPVIDHELDNMKKKRGN